MGKKWIIEEKDEEIGFIGIVFWIVVAVILMGACGIITL